MKIYYVKMLIFTFLISTLVSPHNENYQNNHYNVSFIQNNTKRTTIKSRLLAQTKNHNPHYHNDPELKEIIDKLNDEAIKKFQQTHEPYEQLKELVEKNGTKLKGGNGTEHMSTIEKELLETYEDVFGEEHDIMLKSGMYPNDDDKSNNSSTCECTDTDNTELAKTKGRDKYLKHLKHRCIGGICSCSIGSALLTWIGTKAAKAAAITLLKGTSEKCISAISIFDMLSHESMTLAINTSSAAGCVADYAGAATTVSSIFVPCGITALVLLILAVVLIILYIWLYKRRKSSWKHECKKHLCK
ncbi:stevor PIR protein, putative [Plasmodium reichenowi]|uniref:Stevor PIR protein, putative n=1 Tax=Plasmodium reichenowi TaxID=5854 RepID=A0A2P9DCH4_PLARE|nr:stevor PIR protein, putative [Plasmodium reichenowi]